MFFRKPAFGLDISDYSTEIVLLEGSLNSPRLLAMGREILKLGIFENGKIIDKEKLAITLRNLIENPKFGEIKTKKFVFSIPESKSFIHIFELPKDLKESTELVEMVKSQADQFFPYPVSELYFDFQIQGKEVLLAAAPRIIVDDYLEVFKNCGLEPLALEIESISLTRALLPEIKKPTLIADIGARTTNLSVFDEKGLRLSFSTPIAGNLFTQALSEKLNILPAAAEILKKEIGLNPKVREGRVFLILQKEIQGIIEEINKIIQYFQEKTGEDIEKIILAGGSAVLPKLPEFLSDNLQKPVVIGDPWVKINIDILKKKEYLKEALGVNPVFYSTVIGLALRGLDSNPQAAGINLLKGRD